MDKAAIRHELWNLDDKLRELETEAADHAADVANRLKMIREAVEDLRCDLIEGEKEGKP